MATKKAEKVVIADGAPLAEMDRAAVAYAQASMELRVATESAREAAQRVETATSAVAQARDTLLEVASRQ